MALNYMSKCKVANTIAMIKKSFVLLLKIWRNAYRRNEGKRYAALVKLRIVLCVYPT